MKDQISAVVISILQLMAPVVMAGVALLLKKIHDYIVARTKNVEMHGILDRLEQTSYTVVNEVEQAVVPKLDKTLSAADNAAIAKQAAMNSIKAHLGQKGLDDMKNILGIEGSSIESVLSSYLESKVLHVDPATPTLRAVVGGA